MLILCNCDGNHTEKSDYVSKNSKKNRLHKKTFPFSNEYVKNFSVINYGFILFRCQQTLTPIYNSYHHASANAIWKSTDTIVDSS